MQGWLITSGFAGGGTSPLVTWGWKSAILAIVRWISSLHLAITGNGEILEWPLCSKKSWNFSRIASFSSFPLIVNPEIIGFPMNVYGSSVLSPQVLLFSSLVQNLAPVTEHFLQTCPDSDQKGISTSPKFTTPPSATPLDNGS